MFGIRNSAISTLILGLAVLAAPIARAETPPAGMLPLNAVVHDLARKGGEELLEIGFEGGAYRATLRHQDGRVVLLVINPQTGQLRPSDQGDILRNSFDLGILDGLRGALSGALPAGAQPAYKIVSALMASGEYADLYSLRVERGQYRVTMIGRDGAPVTFRVDPVTGARVGAGA